MSAPALGLASRYAALAGATTGLALSPALAPAAGELAGPPAALVGALALVLARPRRASGAAGATLWLLALAACAALAGLALGGWRLAAIDAGALRAPTGARVQARGFVAAVPRHSGGRVRVPVDSTAGRLLVVADEASPELEIGGEVVAEGRLRAPAEWEAGYLERAGIAQVLEARSLRVSGRQRSGAAGLTDGARRRAEQALGRGTPPAQAALLRGFVLGQDDAIDAATVEDFQRSGLAHLLAVSGQNVLLLALLAAPILGALGLPLRLRLACLLALIAVYVPITGAGPSIQRAGIMGAAGVVAALASRPASRWYSLLLAALLTLALNPRASGDVGWQLSFASVVGIGLWAQPLRRLLPVPPERPAGDPRAALADGAAVTIAATLATAPLMAHHFESFSIASLPANLLALPAVAPVMWLGMLVAAAGQLPAIPVEPLTGLAGLLAAYIEQVARWLAAPGWAQVPARLDSWTLVGGAYALIAAALWVLGRRGASRAGLRPRAGRRRRHLALGLTLLAGLALLTLARQAGQAPEGEPRRGLRASVLDVGQGDAILLDPAPGDPVLVDTGPPGGGIAELLADAGVGRLAAVVITHDQLDHSGGLRSVLDAVRVGRLAFAASDRDLAAAARAAAVPTTRLAQGAELTSGRLRLQVLWPPPARVDAAVPDPNELSVVMLARWRRFSMLLTADAEAEAVPIDPGPVDVLKIAHHGSADAGLDSLLDRSLPRWAAISVGAGNPFGHPAPRTLAALAQHHVPVSRTDEDGTIDFEVGRAGWRVR